MGDDLPVGLYTHHKGGRYLVLHVAHESTNARTTHGFPSRVVVYASLSNGTIHVRDLWEFKEYVQWPDGSHGPRFRCEATS